MNKILAAILLIIFTAVGGYSATNNTKPVGDNQKAPETQSASISTEYIREVMDKTNATVDDALKLLSGIDSSDSVNLKKNVRVAKIKPDAQLTAGDFAIIVIESKKIRGGLLYSLTGWGKYAAESLIYQNIYPQYFSWNRNLSGSELIEFVTAIKDKQ